jgi:hypothetical protein
VEVINPFPFELKSINWCQLPVPPLPNKRGDNVTQKMKINEDYSKGKVKAFAKYSRKI